MLIAALIAALLILVALAALLMLGLCRIAALSDEALERPVVIAEVALDEKRAA